MNIGSVWAATKKRTVILELDLRKPKISKLLGIDNSKGVSNFMLGHVALHELVSRILDTEHFSLFPRDPFRQILQNYW